jgi:hypothetical protein
VTALTEAMIETGTDEGTIETMDHYETVLSEGTTIRFVPFWWWAPCSH